MKQEQTLGTFLKRKDLKDVNLRDINGGKDGNACSNLGKCALGLACRTRANQAVCATYDAGSVSGGVLGNCFNKCNTSDVNSLRPCNSDTISKCVN